MAAVTGRCECRSGPVDGDAPARPGGDPGWLAAHAELRDLHVRKAATYGTDLDALANYTATAEAFGEPDEFTCAVRLSEKLTRAINMLRAGRADEIREWPDIAAIALGAEALRRRRIR